MLINGARMLLHATGAMFWPAQALLVVADLHLEKGSAYAARGRFLPPYDTAQTLRRLTRAIDELDPAMVVCLGDSFHDAEAGGRIGSSDIATIADLARGRRWFWVAGNHDPEPPPGLAGEAVDEVRLEQIVLRHQPTERPPAGEVVGHLHPKAAVRLHGRRLTRRCFVGDGLRAVLPAFGAYAGGLDVLDPAFAPVFPAAFDAYLLGRDGVHRYPSRRLGPVTADDSVLHKLGNAGETG